MPRRALLDLVHSHWTTLPRDTRPYPYLHGLSLGVFLSQDKLPPIEVLPDPFDGALWVGSPLRSDFWRMVVEDRTLDSPAWQPRCGSGSLIRTSNQKGDFGGGSGWSPKRLALLQYGSGAILSFDRSPAWRRPSRLTDPRASDLSLPMRWVPSVTFAQVGGNGLRLGRAGPGPRRRA